MENFRRKTYRTQDVIILAVLFFGGTIAAYLIALFGIFTGQNYSGTALIVGIISMLGSAWYVEHVVPVRELTEDEKQQVSAFDLQWQAFMLARKKDEEFQTYSVMIRTPMYGMLPMIRQLLEDWMVLHPRHGVVELHLKQQSVLANGPGLMNTSLEVYFTNLNELFVYPDLSEVGRHFHVEYQYSRPIRMIDGISGKFLANGLEFPDAFRIFEWVDNLPSCVYIEHRNNTTDQQHRSSVRTEQFGSNNA